VSCPGALNIKGQGFQCEIECSNKAAEAIWIQTDPDRKPDDNGVMSTLEIDIRWGIDRETGKPVVAYRYEDPQDPDKNAALDEVIKVLEFVKLSIWDDVRRDNPHGDE
jgi:hypothetical protein